MEIDGGCYCGALRYGLTAAPKLSAQCHCRECQYLSGGGPNYFLLVPREAFAWTAGEPKTYRRDDLDAPVTREFCAVCGTHITTLRPDLDDLIVKPGTLDDPSLFAASQMAVFTVDKQGFHHVPDDLPAFERLPPMRG